MSSDGVCIWYVVVFLSFIGEDGGTSQKPNKIQNKYLISVLYEFFYNVSLIIFFILYISLQYFLWTINMFIFNDHKIAGMIESLWM